MNYLLICCSCSETLICNGEVVVWFSGYIHYHDGLGPCMFNFLFQFVISIVSVCRVVNMSSCISAVHI
ncbi:hypothetical protein LINPERHAP1_LOCUS20792 [Linum perenne]